MSGKWVIVGEYDGNQTIRVDQLDVENFIIRYRGHSSDPIPYASDTNEISGMITNFIAKVGVTDPDKALKLGQRMVDSVIDHHRAIYENRDQWFPRS